MKDVDNTMIEMGAKVSQVKTHAKGDDKHYLQHFKLASLKMFQNQHSPSVQPISDVGISY